MMRFRMLKALVVLVLALLTAVPATAKRTTVDFDPNTGISGKLVLEGYCDLNGDDCVSRPLGFSVDFGAGTFSSFIIYGNGLISFGDKPVDYAKSLTFGAGSSLADFGGAVIAPGLFNSTTYDYIGSGDTVFMTDAYVRAVTGGIGAGYEFCNGPRACSTEATVDLTPVAAGLKVDIRIFRGLGTALSPLTPLAGYSIPGAGSYQTASDNMSFVIPARIGTAPGTAAVPEPGTWTMMIVGFGAIGAALRRRQRPERLRNPTLSRSRTIIAASAN